MAMLNNLISDFSTQEKEILQFLYDNENTEKFGKLNEHLYILAKSKDDEKRPLVFRANTGELVETLKHISVPRDYDVYISKNTLKTKILSDRKLDDMIESGIINPLTSGGKSPKSKRGRSISCCVDNILGLKNIVIDIDAHDDLSPEEFEEAKQAFILALEENREEEGFIKPTLIYWSGRGMHIYYAINEYPAAMKRIYISIVDKLASFYAKLLKEYPLTLSMFELDRSASNNIAGLIRLIGTNNTHASVEPEVIEFNSIKYDLEELESVFGLSTPEERISRRTPKTKAKKRKIFTKNSNAYLLHRLNVLEEIVKCGDYENRRHLIIHLYYNTAINYYGIAQKALALEKTEALNNKFHHPMGKNDFKATIRCIDKKGFYKYSNKAFVDKLNLSDKEIDTYNLTRSNSNLNLSATRKAARDVKKADRNTKIIRAYKRTLSYSLAAKEVGVCVNTVKKVIRACGEPIKNLKKEQRNRKILANFRRNSNIKKAAKAGKVSVSTARNVIKKFKNINKQLWDFINSNNIQYARDIFEVKKQRNYLFNKEVYSFSKRMGAMMNINPINIQLATFPATRLAA